MTARRWVNSIDRFQAARGWPQPGRSEAVHQILKALDAERGRHRLVVMPVMLQDLRSVYSACLSSDRPVRIQDRRDSTMIMVTWIAALRATDVVRLTFDDIGHYDEGLTLRVRSFVDDATVPGAIRLLPRGLDIRSCPVCALYRWHDLLVVARASNDEEGFPFRGGSVHFAYLSTKRRLASRGRNSSFPRSSAKSVDDEAIV